MMARTKFLAILFTCLVNTSIQRSTPDDDSYVAAVIEFQVTSDSAGALRDYVQHIGEAAEQNADIMVFPEMTLRGSAVTVPVHGLLQQYPVPALQPDLYDEILVSISNAARQNQIYVVINLEEILDCTIESTGELCPEQKIYLFNTNVVFDRNGAVIDRYRKINLFGERTRTPALNPDLGVFDTDFGVRFGHFICFDLKFQVPALQVAQKNDITDIIFTTMWFSELPYLTAVQIQEGYAYSLDVNFLASGANNVGRGSAGSGIYSGKAGALVSTMPGLSTTRLLVSRVPKVPGQVTGIPQEPIYDSPADHNSLVLITDPSIPSHISRELTAGRQEITLVDKDITCRFIVAMNQRGGEVQYKYRAAAFSGIRSYSGVATGGVRICSVLMCHGDTINTCGTRFPTYVENSTAIFEELTIIATMPSPVFEPELDVEDSVVYPLSVDVSIMPLEPQDFTYTVVPQGNTTVYTLTLNDNNAELYSFSIWGRVYAPDGEEATPPREDDVTDVESSPETSPDTYPDTSPDTYPDTSPDTSADSSIVHLLNSILLLLPLFAMIKCFN